MSLGGTPPEPGALAAAAAPHATPQAFHALLAAAGAGGTPPVLLDVRNVYETRIGRMQAVGAGPPPLRARFACAGPACSAAAGTAQPWSARAARAPTSPASAWFFIM